MPPWFLRHHGRARSYGRKQADDVEGTPLAPDEVFYCEINHPRISRAPGRAIAKLPTGEYVVQLRSAVYDRDAGRVVTRVVIGLSHIKQIEALDAIAQEIFEE